jgi:hypothetical protein
LNERLADRTAGKEALAIGEHDVVEEGEPPAAGLAGKPDDTGHACRYLHHRDRGALRVKRNATLRVKRSATVRVKRNATLRVRGVRRARANVWRHPARAGNARAIEKVGEGSGLDRKIALKEKSGVEPEVAKAREGAIPRREAGSARGRRPT